MLEVDRDRAGDRVAGRRELLLADVERPPPGARLFAVPVGDTRHLLERFGEGTRGRVAIGGVLGEALHDDVLERGRDAKGADLGGTLRRLGAVEDEDLDGGL